MSARSSLGFLVTAILASACAEPTTAQRDATEPKVRTASADEPMVDGELARGFRLFRFDAVETPCPPLARGDCSSAVELTATGALRLDPWGEPESPVLEEAVTRATLSSATVPLTDPAFVHLVESVPPCGDTSERVLLETEGETHAGLTGGCNEPAVQTMRSTLLALLASSFPGHSLISPPF
ncbi:MAG: hypothetical protein AB7S26_39360 [Sandaracinaceae bacterium]